MSWTVDCTEDARQILVDIWINATDRLTMTEAGNRIDAALARDPVAVGESRVGQTRILIDLPLAVYNEVDTARREVEVFAVFLVAASRP